MAEHCSCAPAVTQLAAGFCSRTACAAREDSDPCYINNSAAVKLRSFTTKVFAGVDCYLAARQQLLKHALCCRRCTRSTRLCRTRQMQTEACTVSTAPQGSIGRNVLLRAAAVLHTAQSHVCIGCCVPTTLGKFSESQGSLQPLKARL